MFNNADAHAHPSIYVGIFLEETYVILFILSKERRNAHDHILGMENSEICPVITARGKYFKDPDASRRSPTFIRIHEQN